MDAHSGQTPHAGECDFCGHFAQVITVEGKKICRRCARELLALEQAREGRKKHGRK